LRYKIKDIADHGLICDQPIGELVLREALEGLDADLARSAGAVKISLSKQGEDIFVDGRVRATVGVPCSLCLGPARVEVDVPVRTLYRPEGADGEGADELEADDVYTHDRKEIDLTPMVREQIILAIPMSVRCRPECAGLCAQCGQDRNVADCGHRDKKDEASPFATLKDVKLDH
jgi:uncharacterized protein